MTRYQGEWIEGASLSVCLGGLPLLPFVSPLIAQILVPLCVLVALAGRWIQGRRLNLPRRGVIFVGAFLGWCLLSLAWSERPALSAHWLWQIALELPFAGLLIALARETSPEQIRACRQMLVFGIVSAAGLAAFELASGGVIHTLRIAEPYYPFVVNRQLVVAALLSFPAALLLWRHGYRWAAPMIVAVPALVGLFGESETALLVVALGIAVLGLSHLAPRAMAALLAVAFFLGVVLAPFVPGYALELTRPALVAWHPGTFLARLEIWTAVARFIGEAPLFGHGLSAVRNFTLPEIAWLYEDQKVTHPHNAALQFWLDLGAIGAAFLATALLALAHMAWRSPPAARATALATAATLAVSISVTWNIWAAWWIATIGGVVAAMLISSRAAAGEPASAEAASQAGTASPRASAT